MFAIVFTKQADRALRKMPRNHAQLIRTKIDEIAKAPYAQHNNVTKLTGRSGYRLRVGDWRILYELQDQQLIMLVVKIAPRGGVYR
jgi:mRNA interferase RelE/StbE